MKFRVNSYYLSGRLAESRELDDNNEKLEEHNKDSNFDDYMNEVIWPKITDGSIYRFEVIRLD